MDGCNTLDQDVTWAGGISALQEGNGQTRKINTLQESYLRKQCFNLWKGRMNGAYAYPIMREFEFQRFCERETFELIGEKELPARKISMPTTPTPETIVGI